MDKKKHHGDVTCHPRENSQLAPWKIGSWKMIPFLWGSAWFFRGYSLVLEEIRWTLCIYYVYIMHILKLSLPYVKKSNQTKNPAHTHNHSHFKSSLIGFSTLKNKIIYWIYWIRPPGRDFPNVTTQDDS